jgi:transcriptional regulator with XRE-family HTH domain
LRLEDPIQYVVTSASVSTSEVPASRERERNFSANVKLKRETLGLSQETLAEKMQERGHPYHQATVYKIESGARRVQLSEALDLAEVLDSDVHRLSTSPGVYVASESLMVDRTRLDKIKEGIADLIEHYRVAQFRLRLDLERYEEAGHDDLDAATLARLREIAKVPITAVVEAMERRLLDSGDGDPNSRLDDLATEQRALIAQWELDRAQYLAERASERLQDAQAELRDVQQAASDKGR